MGRVKHLGVTSPSVKQGEHLRNYHQPEATVIRNGWGVIQSQKVTAAKRGAGAHGACTGISVFAWEQVL